MKYIVESIGMFRQVHIVEAESEEKAFELEANFCKQIGYENLVNLNQEKGKFMIDKNNWQC